ncbi:MAG: PilN domain-containing protein [Terriglobales bacterium]
MRVDINLASHRYEDARRFWFRWGSALAALGILTAWLIFYTAAGWAEARKEHRLGQQYEQQIAARDKQKADAQALMNLPQNASTRDRSQFLNDLFYRKAFSWTQVFEDLEQVMPSGLHVVSIAPELAENNELAIKLVVAGNSHDHALELVRKMEDSQHFQQTRIESETSETGSGTNAGDTVKFDISALYIHAGETPARQGGGQ